MLLYTRNLEFTADPDYQHLRNLLKSVYEKNSIVNDGIYDWMLLKEKKDKGNKEDTCKLL